MFVVVQSLSQVWLFGTPWTAALRLSHPSLSPGVRSRSCPLSWYTIQPSHPLLPPSPVLNLSPASVSFPMSQFFTSGGQSIGASESILPMNIQGWFPLGLTSLISLQSRGFSSVFCSSTIQKHQSSVLSLLYAQSNSCIRTWLLEKS